MEMFYLVLFYTSVIVIPEKYTNEQCIKAGELWIAKQYKCIPAPKPTKCRTEADGPNARMVCE